MYPNAPIHRPIYYARTVTENDPYVRWVDERLATCPELMTIRDVDKVLGIGERQVGRLLRLADPAKRLPGAKFGGSWRIAKPELRQYLLKSHNGSTAARAAHPEKDKR